MGLIKRGTDQCKFEFDLTIKWVKSTICHSEMYTNNVHYWTITSNKEFVDKVNSSFYFKVFNVFNGNYLIILDNIKPIPELELTDSKEYFDILRNLIFFEYGYDSLDPICISRIYSEFDHPNYVNLVSISLRDLSIVTTNKFNLIDNLWRMTVTNDIDRWNKEKEKSIKLLQAI